MFYKMLFLFLLLFFVVWSQKIPVLKVVLAVETGSGYSVKNDSFQKNKYVNSFKNGAIGLFQFMTDTSNSSNSEDNPSSDSSPTPENSIYTPIPTESASDPWTPNITDQGIFSQSVINGASSCLKNQAVYRRVEQETGLAWQMVAGIHFVEGSCGSSASCYSGRTLGVIEPDMRGNCTPHSRKVAGGCIFDNLLNSCLDGAVHFIDKIGKIPRSLPEFAEAARGYNGTGNDNCRPGNSPYTWCPAAFPGADHTHAMSWFDGDIICRNNPNAKYCLYKIYCSDGGKCPFGTRQERLGSVTVAKILGLNL